MPYIQSLSWLTNILPRSRMTEETSSLDAVSGQAFRPEKWQVHRDDFTRKLAKQSNVKPSFKSKREWILLCASGGILKPELLEVEVTSATTDEELFREIREANLSRARASIRAYKSPLLSVLLQRSTSLLANRTLRTWLVGPVWVEFVKV